MLFSQFPSSLPGGVPFRRRDLWPCSSVGKSCPDIGVCAGSSPVKASARTHLSCGHFFVGTSERRGKKCTCPWLYDATRRACPKGHWADCGKTLYRRLTVPNYAPEKGKGHPVCSTGSVGGCNDPQQAGNRLYMPPCSCMRRRRHH